MHKIIAANWKMYKNRTEAATTAAEIAAALPAVLPEGREVLVFPPATAIECVAQAFHGQKSLTVGAQNFYPASEGAFTGEVSVGMLRDVGAEWVLVGHSERRHIFGESDDMVARKAVFALSHGMKTMLCIGEKLEEREQGQLYAVLERQLTAFFSSKPDAMADDALTERFAIAYEPVWAIGTGKVAGPGEVREAHGVTRALLEKFMGETGKKLPILYGGSVKPDNAGALIALDNVDGLLVGGASLEAQSFLQIIGA
ncbi:MAG: triose-phosphate isomerase [Desulfovibrio sp. MES5]|uniref:triose-phosphate isomerase n=1 Tax=Desulfovibrio sp. MES5 TaxID=1899016 RepID=UPI000B9D074A|nr:triose-phosphate isomerase [Desulfovibrio sp. MES5]OXS28508.1 MAG: triose-phosphate isomerase [Desulfovibrio sp. MES5]